MRPWILLLALTPAIGCSKCSGPGSPTGSVGSRATEVKLTEYMDQLGNSVVRQAFPNDLLAAGGAGSTSMVRMGSDGGTSNRTDYNSYRCTAADAGRRMQVLQTEMRKLAAESGLTVEPAEPAEVDDPLAGFRFSYSRGKNRGEVDVTIAKSDNQSDARPDAEEVVYTVRVTVSESVTAK